MTSKMLSVNNLNFKYYREPRHALREVSFECQSAGIIAIVGMSGVGKSTLISVLAGIYTPGDKWLVDEFTGKILLDGYQPGRNCGPDLISWVPQVPALLDHRSVLNNILLPLTIGRVVSKSDRDNAETLLQHLRLERRSGSRPRDLSGGEKTRVSVLRALISRPTYLFLDEPFISLDLGNRLLIYKLLRKMRAEDTKDPTTTVLTTHNIPEATLLANRIIIMKGGDTKTNIQVWEHTPVLASGETDDAACLKRAREAAAPVEEQLLLV